MQIGEVLSTSFAHESRRRRGWLLLAILLELLVLWAIFAIAERRADLARQTTYFDPFNPSLYTRQPFLDIDRRIPSTFLSSFLQTPPVPLEQAELVPVNWQSAALQHILAYKSRASVVLQSYIGTSDFAHGTYTQLGAFVRSATGLSDKIPQVPT